MIKGIRADNDLEIELPFLSDVKCSTTDYGSRETKVVIKDKQALKQFVIDNPDLTLVFITDETNDLTGYFWPQRYLRLIQEGEFA